MDTQLNDVLVQRKSAQRVRRFERAHDCGAHETELFLKHDGAGTEQRCVRVTLPAVVAAGAGVAALVEITARKTHVVVTVRSASIPLLEHSCGPSGAEGLTTGSGGWSTFNLRKVAKALVRRRRRIAVASLLQLLH